MIFWKNQASGPPKTAATDNDPLMCALDPQHTWRRKEIFQNGKRKDMSLSKEGGRVCVGGVGTRNEGHRSRLGWGSWGSEHEPRKSLGTKRCCL